MTKDILQMMNQSRFIKNKNERKYEEINLKLNKKVEELKIKEATGLCKRKSTALIINNGGNLAATVEEKMAT